MRSGGTPSDTRNVLTAMARRSPRARLYSGVPRSSQCPSMVTTQLEYFFSTSAFSAAVARPASSSSALSTPKNTGFSGELRLRSSSVRLEIPSSASGCCGTGSASSTRCGGGAGGGVVIDGGAPTDGGGAGARIGGWRRLQADTATSRTITATVSLNVVRMRLIIRPVGCLIVSGPRDLPEAATVAADGEDLDVSGPRRRERDVTARLRVGGALIRPFAKGQLARRVGGELVDLDVVAAGSAGAVGDLVVGTWRPRRSIADAVGDRQPRHA